MTTDYRGSSQTVFAVQGISLNMHSSDLRLNYSARPGFQPRPMHVQSTKANLHCVKRPRQGFDMTRVFAYREERRQLDL